MLKLTVPLCIAARRRASRKLAHHGGVQHPWRGWPTVSGSQGALHAFVWRCVGAQELGAQGPQLHSMICLLFDAGNMRDLEAAHP